MKWTKVTREPIDIGFPTKITVFEQLIIENQVYASLGFIEDMLGGSNFGSEEYPDFREQW